MVICHGSPRKLIQRGSRDLIMKLPQYGKPPVEGMMGIYFRKIITAVEKGRHWRGETRQELPAAKRG